MAKIKPFKAYMFNKEKIQSVSEVVAPPWDVIDANEEKRLLASSDYNVIRLISQNILPSSARASFHSWMENDILVQDKAESFYFLRHYFTYGGRRIERKGVFALLKLESFEQGNIIPHEHVFEKYHDNRYKLISECHANFSPVFMLYSDNGRKIDGIVENAPVKLKGSMGNDEFLFGSISGEDELAAITGILNPSKLFIADGHHRYQAAWRFFTDNPEEKNGYVLVFLSNLESPGLMILPTHRYVAHDISFCENIDLFHEDFIIEEVPGKDEVFIKMHELAGRHVFGIYEKGRFFVIYLKNEDALSSGASDEKHSAEWLSLDNVILKNRVFDRLFSSEEKEVTYNPSAEYLLGEYARIKKGFIAFVNPVSKESFMKISLNGEKMPQKTTYFYPKVPTGFVINKF